MSEETGLSSIITAGVQWIPSTDSECLTCNGRGGELEFDIEGDGVWATPVYRFNPCEDCIGAGRCPGCGAAMTPDQQIAANKDIESLTCSVGACGWSYDADRFYDEDPISEYEGWGFNGYDN